MSRVPAASLGGVLGGVEKRMRGSVADAAYEHDPEFLARILPYMERFASWFDAEVLGMDRIPPREEGPFLLVGNHSGGLVTADTPILFCAWYRERGFDEPITGLATNVAFALEPVGRFFRRLGEVPASARHAGEALDAGRSVLVYPGGDWEAFRPWQDRNRIDFGGRNGFVRLALRHGVPVVPIVGHGGHETLFVLSRGNQLAHRIGLGRLDTKVFPVVAGPLGLSPGVLAPQPPLPSKVTVEVCEPLDWSSLGPHAAEDDAVVDACYDEITAVMQETMDRLAVDHPRPLVEGLLGKILPVRRSTPSR